MTIESDVSIAPSRSAGRARTRRGLVVAGATAAALAVWMVADPVAGLDLAAESGGTVRPVGPGAVATVSLLAALAGWALLAVMERLSARRRTARPRRTWAIVAVAVLVVSLAGPLGSGADAASTAVLAGMHVAVAAVLVPGLSAGGRPRRPLR
jgi:hypothetical protein